MFEVLTMVIAVAIIPFNGYGIWKIAKGTMEA